MSFGQGFCPGQRLKEQGRGDFQAANGVGALVHAHQAVPTAGNRRNDGSALVGAGDEQA